MHDATIKFIKKLIKIKNNLEHELKKKKGLTIQGDHDLFLHTLCITQVNTTFVRRQKRILCYKMGSSAKGHFYSSLILIVHKHDNFF